MSNNPRALILASLLMTAACGPSERSETEQQIVDVYEAWSANVRPESCPRYYGFPNCPDINGYKSEINQHCDGMSPTSNADLNAMLHEGWRIQSHDKHDTQSDVTMQDDLVLDITCKGERYVMVRTCVTKINIIGQETPDPKCAPPKPAKPAEPSSASTPDEPVGRREELDTEPTTPAADPSINRASLLGGWVEEGGSCSPFATIDMTNDGELLSEGLEGTWTLSGSNLTWSYKAYEMGDDPADIPLTVQTGTVRSVGNQRLEVAWNGKDGLKRYHLCPDQSISEE